MKESQVYLGLDKLKIAFGNNFKVTDYGIENEKWNIEFEYKPLLPTDDEEIASDAVKLMKDFLNTQYAFTQVEEAIAEKIINIIEHRITGGNGIRKYSSVDMIRFARNFDGIPSHKITFKDLGETQHFGNNWLPQSNEEVICDITALMVMIAGSVLFWKKRK